MIEVYRLLGFLNIFVATCSESNVPEEVKLDLVSSFLPGTPLTMLHANHLLGRAEQGSFLTWQESFNTLLRVYVTDQAINEAVRRLITIVQEPTE